MDNVAVFVEDEPPADDPELLGWYEGTPLTERDWTYGGVLPDRIVIYPRPHAADVPTTRTRSSTRCTSPSCTRSRTTSASTTTGSTSSATTDRPSAVEGDPAALDDVAQVDQRRRRAGEMPCTLS